MPYFRAFQLFWLRLPYLWIQSLLWWISIVSYFDIQVNPCWNRTLTYHFPTSISLNHDWTLGGPRYIHLTKETNAVFPGFFDPLAPAAIIYNSNTFVMNYLFLISSDFSDFASLSDPQTLPFFFKKVPPWFYLRRRILYPTELQRFICFTWNIYRIFILHFIIIHFHVFRNYFLFLPAPYVISV